MRTIKELMRQQIDELEDVIMYSCDALEHRPLRPGLADVYHKLAQQEENHASLLADQLTILFNELLNRNPELPPELMKKMGRASEQGG